MFTTEKSRRVRGTVAALLLLTGLVACSGSDNENSQSSVVEAPPARAEEHLRRRHAVPEAVRGRPARNERLPRRAPR